ncbi:2-oxoacid:acceptor oxidoreductase family protein [Palleronia caenipelagi]|uniref:Pyruvate oxidoreductase subunit gamma n=1 Tax=Palleronia caenipelagi TaxID=2489174 RepID=A0A547Q942_9RHOB|nr:2-oxoacid:acceptor oxidoreductase family protein [Palleronia caenipelagi]TRD22888.1 pyruvate oxidoreductase subunit gamma [Palleronia caenipelagi]
MIEYRMHGRGGQGSVAAAYLLAATAFEAGWQCQAFPSFGAERRGAPVTAFVRVDQTQIHLRSQIRTPDVLIVQDDTLLQDERITAGLKSGGAMLVNTARDGGEIGAHFGCRCVNIDATELAITHLRRPIPNTGLLAALVTLEGRFALTALEKAVSGRFNGTILEQNLALIADAAAAVSAGAWAEEMSDA